MGRRLVKRPKLTFELYNQIIEEVMALENLDEEKAMDKAWEILIERGYTLNDLDINDALNKKMIFGATSNEIEVEIKNLI